jgi:hypothetical protein
MTEDLFGNPVDPAGFETLGMVYSDVGLDAFLADLCEGGAADAASVHGYVEGDARGRTALDLSSMSFLGTPAEPFEVGSTVELVWSRSDMPVVGVEMLVLLSVVDGGSESISVVWP